MKVAVTPKSDQWNADDLIGSPRTFTIAGVREREKERPTDPKKFEIELAEGEGRVWRPPNGMMSVLIQLWGDEASAWRGRRVTLFCDPSVRFGKETPGGIRISHMSDIGDKPVSPKITITRGRKGPYAVQPLVDAVPVPQRDWLADAATLTSADELRALWVDARAGGATPDVLAGIQALAQKDATPPDPEPLPEQ